MDMRVVVQIVFKPLFGSEDSGDVLHIDNDQAKVRDVPDQSHEPPTTTTTTTTSTTNTTSNVIDEEGLERLERVESQLKSLRQDFMIFTRDISAMMTEILLNVKAMKSQQEAYSEKKKEKRMRENRDGHFPEMTSQEKREMFEDFEDRSLLSMADDTQPWISLAEDDAEQKQQQEGGEEDDKKEEEDEEKKEEVEEKKEEVLPSKMEDDG